MALHYKMTEDGKSVALNDKGFIVMIDTEQPDGKKEIPVDAVHIFKTAQESQAKIKNLTDKIKEFESFSEVLKKHNIEKPADIEKVIKDAESAKKKPEYEEMKKAALAEQQEAFNKQTEELKKQIAEKESEIFDLTVRSQFRTSKFVTDQLTSPSIAERMFVNNFRVEKTADGKYRTIGYLNGEKILSPSKGFEPADFDEALEILVTKDPDGDNIRKAKIAGGTGMQAVNRQTAGVKNPFKKETFNLTEQGKMFRENPELAARLKAEAGN